MGWTCGRECDPTLSRHDSTELRTTQALDSELVRTLSCLVLRSTAPVDLPYEVSGLMLSRSTGKHVLDFKVKLACLGTALEGGWDSAPRPFTLTPFLPSTCEICLSAILERNGYSRAFGLSKSSSGLIPRRSPFTEHAQKNRYGPRRDFRAKPPALTPRTTRYCDVSPVQRHQLGPSEHAAAGKHRRPLATSSLGIRCSACKPLSEQHLCAVFWPKTRITSD